MASPVIPASSATSTKAPSGESKVQSGKTKGRSGLNDSDGWAEYNGYMNAKKYKLDEQFNLEKTGRDSNIFSGVAIYVNGYTNPSSDELRRILQKNGGRYEMYLSKTRVTHVVATNLPNSKYNLTKTLPVVRPEWITDSVAAGKRLPHVHYLLIGNKSMLQPSLRAASSVSSETHHKMSTFQTQNLPLILPKEEIKHPDVRRVDQDIVNYVKTHHVITKADIEHPGTQSFAGKIYETPLPNVTDESNLKTCTSLDAKTEGHISHSDKKQSEDSVVVKDEDDDIVYNSEDDDIDKKGGTKSTNILLYSDASPNKRRSRVYSLRTIRKSNSFSIDTPGGDGTNSCDGFINCPKLDLVDCKKGLNERALQSLFPDHVAALASSAFTLNDSVAVASNDSPSKTRETSCNLSFPVTGFSSLICPERQLAQLVPESVTTRNSQFDLVVSSSSNIHQSSSSETSNLDSGPSEFSSSLFMKQSHISRTSPLQQEKDSDKSKSLSIAAASYVATSDLPHASLKQTTPDLPHTLLKQSSSSDLPHTLLKQTPTSDLPHTSLKQTHQTPSSSDLQPTSLKQTNQAPSTSSSTMAKAGDKNFLSEFYSNSRLHHIATWGAGFKAYVSEIQRSHDHSYPSREKLRQAHIENVLKIGHMETLSSARLEATKKTIMHIDMDCFFVSVGLLARPELKGRPVAVTHSRGQGSRPNPDSNENWERSEWMKKRNGKLKSINIKAVEEVDIDDTLKTRNASNDGLLATSTGTQSFHSMAEIASCSYEARKAGVKNGMFMGQAVKLCPNLQTIPYDFDEYNRVSKVLYDVVASYTHDIEAVSCDEMLIDCSDLLADTGATAMEFAQVLRAEMLERTGCSASAGIGPNILLARLATRRAKPNSQFEVSVAEAKDFITDQSVSDLPGVGYSMSRKLALLGVHTCGDLQNIPLSTLKQEFGPKTGEMLHGFCVGQDNRDIQGNKQRKSVSAEVNYGIRFTKELEAVTFLRDLSLEVKKRLDAIGVKGRSITLKLMVRRPDAPVETAKFMGHGICNTFNKSSNLPLATNDDKVIAREVVSLYRAQRVLASDIRGIGIHVNKLERTGTAQGNVSGTHTGGHQSILQFAVPKVSRSVTTATANHSDLVTITTAASPVAHSEYRSITKAITGHASMLSSSKSSSETMSVEPSTSVKCINGESVDPFTSLKSFRDESSLNPQWGSSETNMADSSVVSTKCTRSSHRVDPTEKCHTGQQVSLLQTCSRSHRTKFNSPSDCVSENNSVAVCDSHGHTSSVVPTTLNHAKIQDMLNYCDIPSTSQHTGDDVYASFLTESQIDSAVLHELPSEIAQEILDDLRLRKGNKQILASSSSHSPGLLAGDDRGSDEHVEKSSKCVIDMGLSEGLPSLSQLDLTCFSALPLNLQDELMQAYARQEVTSKTAADKMVTLTEGDNFPRLKTPPNDKRGKQPKNLSRRGRFGGKRILTFGNNRGKGGSSDNWSMKVNTVRTSVQCSDVINCDDSDEDTSGSRDRVVDDESNDARRVPSTTHPLGGDIGAIESIEDLTFCGACHLQDVRNLMKEWLQSCPVPQDDDVAMVTEYLVKLVQLKNLEQAFYLLKFLTRRVTSQASIQWKECVFSITASVQNVLCAFHGATFKL